MYAKLSVLDTLVVKVDALLSRIATNDVEIKKINPYLVDLHNGYDFIEHEVMAVKSKVSAVQNETVNKMEVEKLETELVDISNRLRTQYC